MPGTAIEPWLQAIAPFQPNLVPGAALDEVDAELHLGDADGFHAWNLKLFTDSPALSADLRERLSALGFDIDPERDCYGLSPDNRLRYGGASPFARQVVRWLLLERGIAALTEEKAWNDDDRDLKILIRDPALVATPLAERFGVRIRADDLTAAHDLWQQLREAGFRDIEISPLEPAEASDARFRVVVGPFARTPEATQLEALAQRFVDRQGVVRDRDPVEVDSDRKAGWVRAELLLPLAACRGGARLPYAGPYPERFTVTVRTDRSHPAIEHLGEQLRERGFSQVEIAYRQTTDAAEEDASGFRIVWNAAGVEAEIGAAVRPPVLAAMKALAARSRFALVESEGDTDKTDIVVHLPVDGIGDGTLFARLCRPRRFCFKLHAPNPAGLESLMAEFRGWDFAKCEEERDADINKPALRYGGAPQELIEQIRVRVREMTGLDPVPRKQWDDHDRDVWLYLPTCELGAPPADSAAAAATGPARLDDWLAGDIAATPRPFLALDDRILRVGETLLSRRSGPRHPMAPSPESFAHYCLDSATAETLAHLAAGVALGEPCLLEGETSTSKTSSILFLAALLDQPVVRINLNGQTDTGELVGRYVPQDLTVSLPFPTEELRAVEDLLEPETRIILLRAEQGRRPLSRVEVVQIMANERMCSHPWRWQDGPIVEALRRGWWVILDEVNLAEPQILERLNSVLEREPMLVLTEYDHRVLGPGGEPIHGDFRIFATMNPAEYAGRSVLSPAYRNRWRAYRQMPRPGEAEYRAMLRFLVFGEQPEIAMLGRRYLAAPAGHPRAALAVRPGIESLLDNLARFQVALEHASGQPPGSVAHLGARRRERYVFTRRDLLSVLDYLASPLATGADDRPLREAIYRYYLTRVTAGQDRQLLLQLLDAAGLTPGGAME